MKIRARHIRRLLYTLLCIPLLVAKGQPVDPSNSSIYVLINQADDQRAVVTSLGWRNLTEGHSPMALPVSTKGDISIQIPAASSQGYAALAIDPRSGTCYYARRSSLDASIWAVNKKGEHRLISKGLHGSYITKMAFGPDGFVYALTIESASRGNGLPRRSSLLRIATRQINNVNPVQVVGVLEGATGFSPEKVFSGDMAIAANGDIYVFGSEWDANWNYYRQGHIFRIPNAGALRSTGRTVQTEYLGTIQGMEASEYTDSTIINGVAFTADGRFLLSACDKGTGSRTYFYQGTLRAGETRVSPVDIHPLPAGWAAADLASPFFPRLPARWPKVTREDRKPVVREAEPTWQASVRMETYTFR